MDADNFALLTCRMCVKFKRNSEPNGLANLCSNYLDWKSTPSLFSASELDNYIKRMEEFKYPIPMSPECFIKRRVKMEFKL